MAQKHFSVNDNLWQKILSFMQKRAIEVLVIALVLGTVRMLWNLSRLSSSLLQNAALPDAALL